MNATRKSAMMTPVACGIITCRKVRKCPAPSICAASAYVQGRLLKKE